MSNQVYSNKLPSSPVLNSKAVTGKIDAETLNQALDGELKHFERCILVGFSFKDRDLSASFFKDCDLRGCDFRGSNLENAKILNCDIRGANLSTANLAGTDLTASIYN